MPRPLRRAAGAALAICTLTGVLTAAAPSATASTHKRTYTVWASASRTASARVTVHATMSATVTAKVSVPGYRTVSASATAIASATNVGTARASAKGRGSAVSTVRSRAAARAHTRAVTRAIQHSHTAAVVLAKQRASAAAKALAHSRAVALAKKESLALAEKRAAPLRQKAAAPVTSPGTPSSTPPAPPVTDPGTTTVDPGTSGTGAGTGCGGASLTKADGSAWTCTFDDEFDGTTLNAANWTAQTTAGSGFTAGPTCFKNDGDNVSVADGTLALTVRDEGAPFTCASPLGNFTTRYTSGSVMGLGKFSQTYGRFEVRAKLPAATVRGLQETLWLWPNDPLKYGPWPGSGEIDLGEFYSQYAGWNIPYIHYNTQQSTVSWATNTNVYTALPAPYAQPGMNCRIDQSGFNTYTATWEPGRITLQVNGTNCIIDNYTAQGQTGGAPFDQPFFMALTQGLGIGANAFDPASTPLPATTLVDYVRIWK